MFFALGNCTISDLSSGVQTLVGSDFEHGWSGHLCLPRGNILACHAVGNSVAEIHALRPIFAAILVYFREIDQVCPLSFQQVIDFWTVRRARVSDLALEVRDEWITARNGRGVVGPSAPYGHPAWVEKITYIMSNPDKDMASQCVLPFNFSRQPRSGIVFK